MSKGDSSKEDGMHTLGCCIHGDDGEGEDDNGFRKKHEGVEEEV